ncbi:MAG TPA: GreA/GreB family elongation factor [Candidatus Dojkabacteria bacterium]|nr:GreA/GreB family elongation factor [Candidatus Dojkabacteria bacterium]
MIFGKKYKITSQKKAELEKELHKLETSGRDEIADRLDFIRQQPADEDDYPFVDVLDDKEYLEKRILEIKDILSNSQIIEDESKHDKVEVGSKVKVGFEGFEDEYLIVSSVEADPLSKKISDESPVGQALVGAKVGDTVDVQIGHVQKKFRVLKIT